MKNSKNKPKREPQSRVWFLGHDYTPIDPTLVHGRIFYIRVTDMDVSILNEYGQKAYIEIEPNEKASINGRHTNFYYYLKFSAGGRTRHVPISLIVMATFNHQVPDRSKGEVIDHIDGNTLNNNPHNLRIISRTINDRDGGFMRKLRNNGIRVEYYSGIILEGYERLAEWKAAHTEWQYSRLSGDDLKRVFLGPEFRIINPDILIDREPNKYADPFIERN